VLGNLAGFLDTLFLDALAPQPTRFSIPFHLYLHTQERVPNSFSLRSMMSSSHGYFLVLGNRIPEHTVVS
jgi:hypothetical protein